jgi:hypothetical protein
MDWEMVSINQGEVSAHAGCRSVQQGIIHEREDGIGIGYW